MSDEAVAETTETPVETGTLLDKAVTQDAPIATSETDWLPEKFQVKNADGVLDESASARKLAESYKALEQHKGALTNAPATPDDYTIEAPKGEDGKPLYDIGEFTSDPLFKDLASKAHELGVSNEQMQLFVNRYLELAPELIQANEQLTQQEASSELSKLWTNEQTFNSNIAKAQKAVMGFGAEADDVPGSRSRLNQKFGNDPDFLALMANIGAEMKEDKLPNEVSVSSTLDVEALMKSEAYWQKNHPDHERVKSQVQNYYQRKHGNIKHGSR